MVKKQTNGNKKYFLIKCSICAEPIANHISKITDAICSKCNIALGQTLNIGINDNQSNANN